MSRNRPSRRAGASSSPFRGPGAFALALAAAAGMTAPSMASPTRMIMVLLCGGGVHPLELPNAPDNPDRHCDKACHAIGRKRLAAAQE